MKKISLISLFFQFVLLVHAQTPPPHTRQTPQAPQAPQIPHTLMDTIMSQLAYVFKTDQQYRIPLEPTIKKYGWNSPQVDSLEELMGIQDSINLRIVTHIIDTYGWLGPDSIGPGGSSALWTIIQHSDLDVQQKYLPVMRDAVQHSRASASDLAYLEDRVALQEGRKQIYGTQFQLNTKTNTYSFAPIEDELNVDKRRAAVGLEPLEDYARENGITYKLPPPTQSPPSTPPPTHPSQPPPPQPTSPQAHPQ
jgi:hypothetical protein